MLTRPLRDFCLTFIVVSVRGRSSSPPHTFSPLAKFIRKQRYPPRPPGVSLTRPFTAKWQRGAARVRGSGG